MKKKREVPERMEYGYLTYRKKKLWKVVCTLVLIAFLIFIVGLALNKWDYRNIFTVLAVLFSIPCAKNLTTIILLAPYHTAEKEKFEEVSKAVRGHGLLLSDCVFTSTERAMHADFIVLMGNRAICFQSDKKKKAEKEKKKQIETTQDYLNKHFKNQGTQIKAKIYTDYKSFLNAISFSGTKKEELLELEKIKESMRYFMV